MEYKNYEGKTVDDAITLACQDLMVTSSNLDYEIISEGSTGFLGFGSKPASIKARIKEEEKEVKKETVKEEKKEAKKAEKQAVKEEKKEEKAAEKASKEENKAPAVPAMDPKVFLTDVFNAMNLQVEIKVEQNNNEIDIELAGPDMGVLIGKRGQTLDSLQYLTSLVVNKGTSEYIRVKVDTEDYRKRRKETLENLAKNLAYKVKRTKRPFSLEPMNPYERRVIHSALQNDKYVSTHSEGEEPFRKVVITLNKNA